VGHLNAENLKLNDIGSKEIFDWGFQKICHQTKELVTSFVTSEVMQQETEQPPSNNQESTLLSESPTTSKIVSKVGV
jgi:hypothetical protein